MTAVAGACKRRLADVAGTWTWEPAVHLVKVALFGICILVEDPTSKYQAAAAVLFALLASFVCWRPLRSHVDGWLQALALGSLVVHAMCEATYQQDSFIAGEINSSLLGSLWVFVACLQGLTLLVLLWGSFRFALPRPQSLLSRPDSASRHLQALLEAKLASTVKQKASNGAEGISSRPAGLHGKRAQTVARPTRQPVEKKEFIEMAHNISSHVSPGQTNPKGFHRKRDRFWYQRFLDQDAVARRLKSDAASVLREYAAQKRAGKLGFHLRTRRERVKLLKEKLFGRLVPDAMLASESSGRESESTSEPEGAAEAEEAAELFQAVKASAQSSASFMEEEMMKDLMVLLEPEADEGDAPEGQRGSTGLHTRRGHVSRPPPYEAEGTPSTSHPEASHPDVEEELPSSTSFVPRRPS